MRPGLVRARRSIARSIPEVRLGAVRRPGGVKELEGAVMSEHPVANLVLDENLLLDREVAHGSQCRRQTCRPHFVAAPRRFQLPYTRRAAGAVSGDQSNRR